MSVMLDAGHGGKDSGAIGNGSRESDLNLLWVSLIDFELGQRGHFVHWTRFDDTDVTLQERVNQCNGLEDVECFVSVHCNSNDGPPARGFEVFHHPSAPQRSRDLAEEIVAEWPHPHVRGVKAANYKVLRDTKVPAVLIELGFINHPTEGKNLDKLSWALPAAEAIAEAIHEWLRG